MMGNDESLRIINLWSNRINDMKLMDRGVDNDQPPSQGVCVYIYVYIYMCVYVCVCLLLLIILILSISFIISFKIFCIIINRYYIVIDV